MGGEPGGTAPPDRLPRGGLAAYDQQLPDPPHFDGGERPRA